MLVELRIPAPDVFDGLETLRDRVERLATKLAAFYERGEPWWRAYAWSSRFRDSSIGATSCPDGLLPRWNDFRRPWTHDG